MTTLVQRCDSFERELAQFRADNRHPKDQDLRPDDLQAALKNVEKSSGRAENIEYLESQSYESLFETLFRHILLLESHQVYLLCLYCAQDLETLKQIHAKTQYTHPARSDDTVQVGGSEDDEEQETLRSFRKQFECFVFRAYRAIRLGELWNSKKMGDLARKTKRRKGSDDSPDTSDWIHARLEIVQALNKVMKSVRMEDMRTHGSDIATGLVQKIAFGIMVSERQIGTRTYEDLLNACVHVLARTVLSDTSNDDITLVENILNDLKLNEHLSVPIARLLTSLYNDFNHPHLMGSVLAGLSEELITTTGAARSFSSFLQLLGESCPKGVYKCWASTNVLQGNENFQVRKAVLDCAVSIITKVLKENDPNNGLGNLLVTLVQRTCDRNTQVRVHALKCIAQIQEASAIPNQQRLSITETIIDRLEDEGTSVRKAALSLLARLVDENPFAIDNGNLNSDLLSHKLKECTARVAYLRKVQAKYRKEADLEKGEEQTGSEEEDGDSRMSGSPKGKSSSPDVHMSERNTAESDTAAQEELGDPVGGQDVDLAAAGNEMMETELKIAYYTDAVAFANIIDDFAAPFALGILYSKNTQEVLAAVEFFRVCHFRKLKSADRGIRSLIHIVPAYEGVSTTSSEGSVKERIIECYNEIYFGANTDINRLVEWVLNMSLKELASCEQLMSHLVATCTPKDLEKSLLRLLGQAFSGKREDLRKAKGAMALLSMVSRQNLSLEHFEQYVSALSGVGLGSAGGPVDLVLASVCCQVLGRLGKGLKLPASHRLFTTFEDILLRPTKSKEWFGLAREVMETIFGLAERPDWVWHRLVRHLLERFVGPQYDHRVDVAYLERAIFIIARGAILVVIFLEHYKSHVRSELRRQRKEKGSVAGQDEMELATTAPVEDTVAETLNKIREVNFLGSVEQATLLNEMSTLVNHIRTSNSDKFKSKLLYDVANLAVMSLMCVSPTYCSNFMYLWSTETLGCTEKQWKNMIVALADIMVAFRSKVTMKDDEGRGLEDPVEYLMAAIRKAPKVVSNTALLSLIHLVQNGMVKMSGLSVAELARLAVVEKSAPAKQFFQQQKSLKEPTVYNYIPEVIGILIDRKESGNFRAVVEYLCSNFVDKERKIQNLMDIFFNRMKFYKNDEEAWDKLWTVIGILFNLKRHTEGEDGEFVPGKLPFEKYVTILQQKIKYFRHTLRNEGIWYRVTSELLGKCRAFIKSEEGKAKMADLDRELTEERQNVLEEAQHEAEMAVSPKKDQPRPQASPATTAPRAITTPLVPNISKRQSSHKRKEHAADTPVNRTRPNRRKPRKILSYSSDESQENENVSRGEALDLDEGDSSATGEAGPERMKVPSPMQSGSDGEGRECTNGATDEARRPVREESGSDDLQAVKKRPSTPKRNKPTRRLHSSSPPPRASRPRKRQARSRGARIVPSSSSDENKMEVD